MARVSGVLSTCVLCVASASAVGNPAVAEGWRFPSPADVNGDWQQFAKPGRPAYHAQADFNGDGVRDDAYIAIAQAGTGWALFVNLNAKQGPPQIIKLDVGNANTAPQRMGVAVAGVGT